MQTYPNWTLRYHQHLTEVSIIIHHDVKYTPYRIDWQPTLVKYEKGYFYFFTVSVMVVKDQVDKVQALTKWLLIKLLLLNNRSVFNVQWWSPPAPPPPLQHHPDESDAGWERMKYKVLTIVKEIIVKIVKII